MSLVAPSDMEKVQKKINRIEAVYSYNVKKEQDKNQKFRNDLFIEMCADSVFATIFTICPTDRDVLYQVARLVRENNRNKKKLEKLSHILGVEERQVINEVKDLIAVEDENQELKEEKLEILGKSESTTKNLIKRVENALNLLEQELTTIERERAEIEANKLKVEEEIYREEKKS